MTEDQQAVESLLFWQLLDEELRRDEDPDPKTPVEELMEEEGGIIVQPPAPVTVYRKQEGRYVKVETRDMNDKELAALREVQGEDE